MLQSKPYVYGRHFAPHDSTKTEIGSGLTIILSAERLGINFEKIDIISINQRIDKCLMMFPRLIINELSCEQFLSAIQNYRKEWDEKKLDWKQEPFKDWTNHYADMLSYASLVDDKMTNETPSDISIFIPE